MAEPSQLELFGGPPKAGESGQERAQAVGASSGDTLASDVGAQEGHNVSTSASGDEAALRASRAARRRTGRIASPSRLDTRRAGAQEPALNQYLASIPVATGAVAPSTDPGAVCQQPFIVRAVTWLMTGVWRTCVDWRSKRPFLSRLTAHVSVLALALVVIAFGGMGLPALRTAVGGSLSADAALPSVPAGGRSVQPTATLMAAGGSTLRSASVDTVVRLPVPHTTFPDRVRTEIITYTIQSGDTIYGIALKFGVSPETVVWSNQEALWDAPWLIKPGLELYIIPVDGVLHTVRAQETVASIALDYGVDTAAIYNEWNNLEQGVALREGQLLVVAGAQGEEIEWEPPPLYPSAGAAGASYGICSGVGVAGPGGNGWFVLPTGSPHVSGWYFHDPRNPTHIGLDYGCRTGDPIYAADNGVVTIAGWNGGYGVLVELNHGNGFITRYAHLSQLNVACGTPVYQGTIVGYCGSTGYSTGSHLHFEIRFNGVPQNPQGYLP